MVLNNWGQSKTNSRNMGRRAIVSNIIEYSTLTLFVKTLCEKEKILRDPGLFFSLCITLMLILICSVALNFYQGVEFIGNKEFVVIGFLVFLVVGDEFATLKASKDGIELSNVKTDEEKS